MKKHYHYEIVLLIHPDRSEQIGAMIQRYQDLIKNDQGSVHRFEDWGRRQLAYPIAKVRKAHYLLMNIECSIDVMNELKELLKYNDAVLRNFVLRKESAITEPSPMTATVKSSDKKSEHRDKVA